MYRIKGQDTRYPMLEDVIIEATNQANEKGGKEVFHVHKVTELGFNSDKAVWNTTQTLPDWID